MKLLVLSLLVAAAAASPLLGSDRCTWGPSYWCSHVKAAKECNAVEHCISTVWKNQKVQAVQEEGTSGELCKFCEDTMTEVQKIVTTGEQQIKAYLEQACSVIPDATLASECKATIDLYLDQIIKMVIAQLDPKTICTALGFCTAASQPKPQAQKPLDTVLGHVQLIKTQTKDVKTDGNMNCEICKMIMTAAREEIESNSTQAEVEAFIEKYMCGNLGSIKEECDKIVQQYAPIIFQFLADEMDPETLCRAIGICTSSQQKKPLMSVLREKNGVQTMNQIPLLKMSPAKKHILASPQCTLCEFLISKLEDTLKENATEQEIIDAVNKDCSLLPKSLADQCHALVNAYGKVIISLLTNEVDPAQICTFLGVCKAGGRVPKVNYEGDICILCETMAMYLQGLLKEKSTQVIIRQELQRVCSFLPDSVSAVCDGIVMQYGDKIVLALANKISAKDLCQFLSLCSKSKTYKEPKIVEKLEVSLKSNALCPICEFAVSKIDDMLKENKTEAAIIAAMEKICTILPSTVKTECDDFIQQYGKIVIQLLATELDPKMICTAIGVCTSKKAPVKKVEITPTCQVCKLAAGYIKAQVGTNATQAQIEAALESLCGYLPSSVKAECDNLVEQYGPILINLLVQELDPDVICKQLGLCTSQTVANQKIAPSKPQLLGDEKCTYGPSYWCANFDNAKKCKAVEHCNKHVWKNEV